MWAILVAAGRGERMRADRPKQYLPLAGEPIVLRSLDALAQASSISGIVVVLAPDDSHWPTIKPQCNKPLRTVVGGTERADSVLAGLKSLAGQCGEEDWVLVHDAARPLLQPALIEKLEGGLLGHPCGGLLALPARDTLKLVKDGDVIKTLDRGHIWQAQTPQIYRYQMLIQALESARVKGVNVTDETLAMELAGHRPRVVEGSINNIKITVPEDIALAEYLLARREKGEP